jgi:hypothetical protein
MTPLALIVWNIRDIIGVALWSLVILFVLGCLAAVFIADWIDRLAAWWKRGPFTRKPRFTEGRLELTYDVRRPSEITGAWQALRRIRAAGGPITQHSDWTDAYRSDPPQLGLDYTIARGWALTFEHNVASQTFIYTWRKRP